ncbi:cytochrome c3 family protein [Tautonia sociabilis]|uniref:Uncharacterized protein n=1 Tax=Tautonia sociabilis TaxID=2080755 RepID=A0A432MII1_9BACT|nr:hypothetical protein [Tautonia sociabilis]RUL87037.1 hypothetical protein TsocGM_14690 [Tautonia sociabilis]
MKLRYFVLPAVALCLALFAGFYFLRGHPGGERPGVLSAVAWQRMASPGALSRPHAFLEHNCAACHTPARGVEAANCIACHANNESLLGRQPTAFHADIGSCRECHLEHRGVARRPTDMDHAALAAIGLRQPRATGRPGDEGAPVREQLVAWLREAGDSGPAGHPEIAPREAILDCTSCHAHQDRHREFFGRDCAQCHGTTAWAIAAFRHPSPQSRDCAQCHQAPPSHYMMHFQMVSASVAGHHEARVEQCYLCHQTTSWNDIKGVGYYKHH